jgi:hypothetical protein
MSSYFYVKVLHKVIPKCKISFKTQFQDILLSLRLHEIVYRIISRNIFIFIFILVFYSCFFFHFAIKFSRKRFFYNVLLKIKNIDYFEQKKMRIFFFSGVREVESYYTKRKRYNILSALDSKQIPTVSSNESASLESSVYRKR